MTGYYATETRSFAFGTPGQKSGPNGITQNTLCCMKTATLITIFCAVVLSRAQAGSIGVDPTSGGAGYVSGFGGLTLGFEFQVSVADGIFVDGLGFWDDQSDGFLF